MRLFHSLDQRSMEMHRQMNVLEIPRKQRRHIDLENDTVDVQREGCADNVREAQIDVLDSVLFLIVYGHEFGRADRDDNLEFNVCAHHGSCGQGTDRDVDWERPSCVAPCYRVRIKIALQATNLHRKPAGILVVKLVPDTSIRRVKPAELAERRSLEAVPRDYET